MNAARTEILSMHDALQCTGTHECTSVVTVQFNDTTAKHNDQAKMFVGGGSIEMCWKTET